MLDTLRKDLHESHGHSFSAGEIDSKPDEVIAGHLKGETLDEFVLVMVEREHSEYFS
ncbi:hypothetical protein ACL1HT_06310 [Corynebacterium striatum]|uniref:hypothetical protein n=1 Tax=Corynebacterium striatum TaxID=43770 RepID=UPI000673CF84|nr:hypothetical protein [Corynebacterium striatum]MDK8808782.1 hypothetical protein [Corynebacterium striatum]MDK8875638.1 hypothetical protein [Corynebacterium striatum]QRP19602.1 hypothetical protein I6J27_04175 [Corynebacterium striatum]CQD14414.1 conserved hypothetical protein [Corynebacterium striatum]HAT1137604.1 hypothetical protein [Corynebacterium striatum]